MDLAARVGDAAGGQSFDHRRRRRSGHPQAHHHAAVINLNGQLLADREFLADARGHAALLAWIKSHGQVQAIGIEGTGFYGVALAQTLTRAGEHVVEVNRANRAARRADGKSDRLDAEQAARSVLAMTARAVPKSKPGTIEIIRMLRMAGQAPLSHAPKPSMLFTGSLSERRRPFGTSSSSSRSARS